MGKTQKAKNTIGITDCPMSAQDLVSAHQVHSKYFEKLRKSGSENELYLKGENLTDKQKDDIYKQDRIPFPMAIMADKLQRFIASERNNRTSFKAEAKRKDVEVKAVLATMRLKDVEGQSNGEYVESDVVASGIGAKFGVVKIILEKDENGENIVKYKKVDYQKFGWDSNAQTYEKDDSSCMWELMPTYRRDIRLDYGDKIADEISIGDNRGSRGTNNYWGIMSQDGNRDLDLINLYEHYQKVIRSYYHVFFDNQLQLKTTNKKEANDALADFKMPYLILGLPIPKAELVKKTEIGIDKYIFTRNAVLEYEQTDYAYFPYALYQTFTFEDEVWCMADVLKSPAKFADKLISQIDYAFAADIKNGWELVTPWLAEGITVSEAIRRVKNGEVVPVLHAGALKSVASHGANPQWMQMYELMTGIMGTLTGGVWAGQDQGRQREAKETVQMKMMQGGIVSGMFNDNKVRFKKNLGEKLLWFLKTYDTAERIIKVHGGDLRPEMLELLKQNKLYEQSPSNKNKGYLTINKKENEHSYLDTSGIDLLISQTALTETQRQMKQQELLDFKNAGYAIPVEVYLEFSDMDYDLKQIIIQANQQQAKAQAQDKEDAKNLEILKATKGETIAGEEVGAIMGGEAVQKKQAEIQQQNQPQPAGQ